MTQPTTRRPIMESDVADPTSVIGRALGGGFSLPLAAKGAGQRLRALTAGNLRRRASVTLGAFGDPGYSNLSKNLGTVTGTVSNETFTTSNPHGLSVGDQVQFVNRTGMKYLNGNSYYVSTVPTPTTFQVYAANGTSGGNQDMGSDGTATGLTQIAIFERTWDAGVLYPISLTITSSNDTFTSNAPHGLGVGSAIRTVSSTAGGVNDGTTYYVTSIPTVTTFTVAATPNGPLLNVTSDGTATLSRANPKYVHSEGRAVQRNTVSPGDSIAVADPTVQTVGPGLPDSTALTVTTITTDSAIEAYWLNNGAGTAYLWIDDALAATINASDLGVSAGSLTRQLLTFPDARPRKIAVQTNGPSLAGWYRRPNAPISRPVLPMMARYLFVGDSFTEGTGSETGIGFVEWVRRHLGLTDVWRCGEGSTGYLYDGTRLRLVARYQNDIINQLPDGVVLCMGLNDARSTSTDRANTVAAAITVWQAILTQLPATELIVVGPWFPRGIGTDGVDYVDPSIRLLDAALQTAAEARGLRYISPIQEGWITGNGHVGATTGNGNADIYTSSDTTHPTAAGHEYLGWRLAGHLAVPHLPLAAP